MIYVWFIQQALEKGSDGEDEENAESSDGEEKEQFSIKCAKINL